MERRSCLLPLVLLGLLGWNVRPSLFVPGASALGRRETLQGLVGTLGAAFGLAGSQDAAWADAFGSRGAALSKYGPVVLQLQEAVDSGDMKAIMKKEGDFKLLNGFWMFQDDKYQQKNDLVARLMSAAESDNKAEVKTLYDEYINDKVITEFRSLPQRNKKHLITVGGAMFTGQVKGEELGGKP